MTTHDTATTDEQFPTDTAGLPEARRHRGRRARRRRRRSSCGSRPSPSSSATRRCACSPTTARSPARRCGCARGRRSSSTSTTDGDLEATVHWHGLRLDNRYDGTHETQAPIPVGEQLQLPRRSSPTPASTGTTRTSARTTARRWASTATSSSSRPIRTTGRRRTASSLLTLDDVLHRGRRIAPFSRDRDDPRGDGPLRQRACSSAARPTSSLDRAARRGRPPLPDQHRQHARVQRRAARRADEARRRRQRPLEHEEFVDAVRARALGARRRRRALRQAGRADARAPDPGPDLPAGRDRRSRDEPATPALGRRSSRRCARNPELAAERERLAAVPATPSRTRRSPSSPRWTWARPKGTVVYACPMHPEVVSDEPGSCPKCG